MGDWRLGGGQPGVEDGEIMRDRAGFIKWGPIAYLGDSFLINKTGCIL